MPQVIKSAEVKIITKEGENQLSITVEPIVIEIKVDVNHSGVSIDQIKQLSTAEPDDEKIKVAPDFSGKDFDYKKIKFGR